MRKRDVRLRMRVRVPPWPEFGIPGGIGVVTNLACHRRAALVRVNGRSRYYDIEDLSRVEKKA